MHFDVLRAGLDLKGRFWDLGCYAEIAAGEFLRIRNQFSDVHRQKKARSQIHSAYLAVLTVAK
jgi:hypothetical protein